MSNICIRDLKSERVVKSPWPILKNRPSWSPFAKSEKSPWPGSLSHGSFRRGMQLPRLFCSGIWYMRCITSRWLARKLGWTTRKSATAIIVNLKYKAKVPFSMYHIFYNYVIHSKKIYSSNIRSHLAWLRFLAMANMHLEKQLLARSLEEPWPPFFFYRWAGAEESSFFWLFTNLN